jgi:hypothetical protein
MTLSLAHGSSPNEDVPFVGPLSAAGVVHRRRRFVSHHKQPQLRVLPDRTRASRFATTTPQSHRNRPMLWFSSSRPRPSTKINRPWRSPSIIESRTFDIAAKLQGADGRPPLPNSSARSQKGKPATRCLPPPLALRLSRFLARHRRQPQLRVLPHRTCARRFTQTTPQSHRNRPML